MRKMRGDRSVLLSLAVISILPRLALQRSRVAHISAPRWPQPLKARERAFVPGKYRARGDRAGAYRGRAPFTPPWADEDDPRRYGHLQGLGRTLT